MTLVEQLAGTVAALSNRVRKLEVQFESLAAVRKDADNAAQIAGEMGFPVEILVLPAKEAERRKLARRLQKDGWSAERIGRALSCSERTIRRWCLCRRPPGEAQGHQHKVSGQ